MDEELFEYITLEPKALYITNWPSGMPRICRLCDGHKTYKELHTRWGSVQGKLRTLSPFDWVCPQANSEEVMKGIAPYLGPKLKHGLDALEIACDAGFAWACLLRKELVGFRRA